MIVNGRKVTTIPGTKDKWGRTKVIYNGQVYYQMPGGNLQWGTSANLPKDATETTRKIAEQIANSQIDKLEAENTNPLGV